jgi:selenocysteine lyase/cysteine desulfurase
MINTEALRTDTPGCREKVHFNNAGASLMPETVIESIENYIRVEASLGGYEAADHKATEINGFYESAARLLNSKASNIAFTSSATNSYARALSCIPFEKGDKVLIANEDYISNQLAFLSLQKRWNVQLIRAASLPEGGVDVEDMKRLMDKHIPRLVSLTHVPTNSGLVQPVEQVGQLCRERDIPYLVDACQSVGQFPVDVQKIQCDFLSATFRKFLRGPRGTGFLYVSEAILKKNWEPLFIDMRGADWTGDNEYKIRADARRFEDWELPYALLLGSKSALDYALSIGLENIQAKNKILCERFRQGTGTIKGLALLDLGKERCSIITVRIPRWQPKDLLEALRKQNINTSISYRDFALIDFKKKGVDWALRVSPHYFNTEEEIDILLNALRELVK